MLKKNKTFAASQEETLKIWEKFVNNDPLGDHNLPTHVLKAWELSKQYNIDPLKVEIPEILSNEEFNALKAENTILLQAAEPMLNMLAASIQDTGYIATFVVTSGYLISVVGDNKSMSKIETVYNTIGVNRGVKETGVSALTLAMIEEKTVSIYGTEHYNKYWHDWICTAAPIFDNNNTVIASLAISCPIAHHYKHIATLTQTCADGITLRLREIVLLENEKRLNAILESIHRTLPELVVTVNTDGTIAHANNNAIAYFGLNENKNHVHISALFGRSDCVRVQQLLQTGELATLELEVISKQVPENLLCRFFPIRAEISEIYGMTISINRRHEILSLTKHISGNYAKYSFTDLKGENPTFKKQVDFAKRAASSYRRILLTGESGTGKELFAQSIHNASAFSSGPFVAISCAAIPRDLIESELFGYVGGAFTGARKNGMIGKIELATGGTLFLDEINSLPLEMQAKLLRVLQQKEIIRIGDTKPTPVNIRIIAATNKNLLHEVGLGNFREDLYFRLNVIEIVIPSLKERKDDISLLSHIFLKRQSLETNRVFKNITDEALQVLYAYHWPGNVRELDNVCERALLWSEDGVISTHHLPPYILENLKISTNIQQTANITNQMNTEVNTKKI